MIDSKEGCGFLTFEHLMFFVTADSGYTNFFGRRVSSSFMVKVLQPLPNSTFTHSGNKIR